ncbi:hypothetical protein [Sinorhizobium fredii]|uniref:hypothetical protein n=1 Tax=Rhizobium fredii TaxID=380 RepID=UPI003394E0EA
MPRFNGIPIEEPSATKPRFGGAPIEQPKVRAPVPDSEYVNNREPGFLDKLYKRAGQVFNMEHLKDAALAADDMVRLTANGMLFGFADRLAGAASEATGIGGGGLEEQRSLTEAARSRAGSAGLLAEIGGGMATLGGAGKQVATRLPGVASLVGRNMGTRALTSGAVGAGLGGLQAVGEGRDPMEAAAIGGTAGLALGPLGETAGRGIGRLLKGRTVPQVFAERANLLFQQADEAGLKVSQTTWNGIVDQMDDAARKAGFSQRLQPKVQAALEDIADMRGKQLSLTEIETVRRFIRDAAKDPDSGRVLGVMVDTLDDALGRLKPTDVVAGNPADARLITAAREMWRKARRLEVLQEASLRADEAEGAFDAALRSQFRKIIGRSDFKRMWTAEEQAAIRRVAGSKGIDSFMNGLGKVNALLAAGGGGFLLGGGSTVAGVAAAGLGIGAWPWNWWHGREGQQKRADKD